MSFHWGFFSDCYASNKSKQWNYNKKLVHNLGCKTKFASLKKQILSFWLCSFTEHHFLKSYKRPICWNWAHERTGCVVIIVPIPWGQSNYLKHSISNFRNFLMLSLWWRQDVTSELDHIQGPLFLWNNCVSKRGFNLAAARLRDIMVRRNKRILRFTLNKQNKIKLNSAFYLHQLFICFSVAVIIILDIFL